MASNYSIVTATNNNSSQEEIQGKILVHLDSTQNAMVYMVSFFKKNYYLEIKWLNSHFLSLDLDDEEEAFCNETGLNAEFRQHLVSLDVEDRLE